MADLVSNWVWFRPAILWKGGNTIRRRKIGLMSSRKRRVLLGKNSKAVIAKMNLTWTRRLSNPKLSNQTSRCEHQKESSRLVHFSFKTVYVLVLMRVHFLVNEPRSVTTQAIAGYILIVTQLLESSFYCQLLLRFAQENVAVKQLFRILGSRAGFLFSKYQAVVQT